MLTDSPCTQGLTICADKSRDIYLIRTINDIVFEKWSSSTKHPDVIYSFNSWENISSFIDYDSQIYQWLLFIASDQQFPFHAKEIADFADKVYHMYSD